MISKFAQLVISSNVSGLKDAFDLINSVGGALIQLGIAAVNAADELNDMSIRTGIAVDRLSVLKATATLSASSLDELIASSEMLSSKLAKQDEDTGRVAQAIERLGVATKDTEGNQKSALQIQEDIIVAADQAKDKHEAEALAVTALGASYYKLRGTVIDVKKEKAAMYDLMAKSGAIVTDDLKNRSDTFKDTLAKLKVVSGGIGNSLTTIAIPALQAAANKVLEFWITFADVLARISGTAPKSSGASFEMDKLQQKQKSLLDQQEQMANGAWYSKEDQARIAKDLANVTESLNRASRAKATFLAQEEEAKKLALSGTPGEGISTGATGIKGGGGGSKGKGGKSDAQIEFEKNEEWREKQRKEAFDRIMEQQKLEEEANEDAIAMVQHLADVEKDAHEDRLDARIKIIEANEREADSIRAQIDPNFKIMEQLENINRLERERVLTQEEAAKAREIEQAKIINTQDTFSAGWENAFKKYQSDAMTFSQAGTLAFTSTVSTMEDALLGFVTTGKLNFKDLARSIIADLARIYAKMLATKLVGLIANAYSGYSNPVAGGSGFGDYNTIGALDAARPTGGGFSAGQRILVGDQGPEILETGSMSGRIIPNQGLKGGGGVTIGSVNIEVKGGNTNEETGMALHEQLLKTMKQVAFGEIANQKNRPGGLLYAQ